jgi:CHAT domain-containing protein
LFFLESDSSANPKLTAFKIPTNKADLAASIDRFRSDLGKGDPGFQSSARALYDRLLKPLEVQLKGKTNIVIVPDGPLWDLPFQVLMDEKGKFLVEKAAVSYAPSLTALREMRKKGESTRAKRKAGAELLAFGNPVIRGDTVKRVQRIFMSEKLEPLPEAERLVRELGKMYGGNRSKVFIGGAASEAVVKSEAPKYRIVQFATHGVLNNISPMYSHLVFAKDEKDRNEDGLLEAWELKDLDLNADMVVLSACDTARGKVSSGEGVIGMTWAAFIAGAPTTVASQWKVESSSTTELMLEFHRQIFSNPRISKAEALRRAAIKLLRSQNYRHPYYWAGFVLIGDGS